MSRLRMGELTALLGVGCLIACLLTPHYESPIGNLDLWDTFGPAAALLLATLCAGLTMIVAALGERDSTALPISSAVWCTFVAAIGTVAGLIRAFERPDHAGGTCIGVWLALAGAALVLAGAWWVMRDERPSRYEPARPEPRPLP